MKFHEWLDLSIRYSNNFAADKVITALGFPYINGVLRQAGFQSPRDPATGRRADPRNGPLFIAGSYDNHDWKPGPDLGNLTKRGEKHYKGNTNFMGSAYDVARLLASVAMNTAFKGDNQKQACQEFLDLMRKGPDIDGNESFIAKGLQAKYEPRLTLSSKIGICDPAPGKPQGSCDCALVKRTFSVGETSYVLAVLGGYKSKPEPLVFNNLTEDLDLCVFANHY
jgi:hypothetical protein